MKKSLKALLLAIILLIPALSSAQAIEELTDIFWSKTSCRQLTPERREAMKEMQTYADSFTHTQFNEYLATPAGNEQERNIEQSGLMRYYNMALDKLLAEIPATKVKKGEVAVWQLYNMGYVIQTPSMAFAIDVYHYRADELAPYIDFYASTHVHEDHKSEKLMKAMYDAGKPVLSNFYEPQKNYQY